MILLECHSEEQERRESWHQGDKAYLLESLGRRQECRLQLTKTFLPQMLHWYHQGLLPNMRTLLMDDEGMWLNFVLLFFICSPDS